MSFEDICNIYKPELEQLFDITNKHNVSLKYIVLFMKYLSNLCDVKSPDGAYSDVISLTTKELFARGELNVLQQDGLLV